ncbi:RDD family protein [Chitinophagaceae bacterium 26-R-25]|nr:RDD family protein [Chitinophagaceae bacterium 26-R-25]
MITQKPDDRLIRNFRLVAVVIGICLALVGSLTIYVILKTPSYKLAEIPLETWIGHGILILGFVGYLQFLFSGFRKSKLLRLFLVYCCIFNLVGLSFYSFILLFPLYSNLLDPHGAVMFGMLALILGMADIGAVALLQRARVPKPNIEDNGGNNLRSLAKNQRLIHAILDMLVVLFIVRSHLSLVNEFFRTNVLEAIADICMIVVYYFVIESLFKTTFGKVVTNSIVVDAKGKKASSGRVLLRALYRFIPFDAISFLSSDRGWHDRLSGTYVINDRYAWENEDDVLSTYFTGEPEEEAISTN